MSLPDAPSTPLHEQRAVGSLRADPVNATIFDKLAGDDLQELADSIKEHGVINPVSIRPDGTIIAGEQRWRAAQIAGLVAIPVIVRDVSDQQVEILRIEENLRRRTLKTSEVARAVRRLYDIGAVEENKGGRPVKTGSLGDPVSPTVTRKDIAEQAGVKETQVKTLNRLADLIPALAALLDAGQITQKVAYQLAQLPAVDQASIAQLGAIHLQSEQEAKQLKERIRELNRQIAEAQRPQPTPEPVEPPAPTPPAEGISPEAQARLDAAAEAVAQQEAQIAALQQRLQSLQTDKEAEIAALRGTKDAEIDRLKAEKWDPVGRAMHHLNEILHFAPQECVDNITGIRAVKMPPSLHLQIVEAALPWLQDYALALKERQRTDRGHGTIRSIK